LFQGAFPDLSDGRVSLSMVTSVEPTTPSAGAYQLVGGGNLSERWVPASLQTFGPGVPACGVRPVQDIQSQEATSRNRTFSLIANEPGMVWQRNVVPNGVTRLSGSWNAIRGAEAGPPVQGSDPPGIKSAVDCPIV
jgi:hypothetical protein